MSFDITAFLASNTDDTKFEKVPVPEWGPDAFVVLRSLTNSERSTYEELCIVRKTKTVNGKQVTEDVFDRKRARALLVYLATCKDIGDKTAVFPPIKTAKGKELFASLSERNAATIEKLFSVASRLSGMLEDDATEDGENPELGNSELGQKLDTGTN